MALGIDAKLYHNTGSFSTPTWSEIPIVSELTSSLEKVMGKIKSRKSKWNRNRPSTRDLSIDFQLEDDPDDAGFQALRDAWLNDTLIDMAAVDQDIANSGAQGPRAEFYVTKFERGEPLEEGMTYSVTIVPGDGGNEPEWLQTA